VWGGIREGLVRLDAVNAAVPADVRSLVAQRQASIVEGRFKPFTAPLTDNEGKVRLASGALDDGAIASMNWLVQGVVGTVPRP
jgi:simple sugar transport system substrate-binding protein